MEVIKEIELKSGRTLQIFQDQSPESPRAWDNLGIMAAFHGRYDLGDKHNNKGKGKRIVPFTNADFQNWSEMRNHILEEEKALAILPLYLYDHSGLSISTRSFNCKWDSGQVGFIYTTQQRLTDLGVIQGQGDGLFEDESDEQFEQRIIGYLIGEVETYDQYLKGDVYGFKLIEKDSEEDVDSCWGFFGDDPKENGMLDHLSPEDQPIDEL